MKISVAQIKKIRSETGAPVVEIKKALEGAAGNEKKAREILRETGFARAAKKANRPVGAGIVETYIHHTQTSGATVVLQSETDFVARNPEFKNLAHEIAAQIVAMNPRDKEELLKQPYIRDESKTVVDLVKENIAKFGENIQIKDFKRFEV